MTRTLPLVLLIALAGCSCSPKVLLRPDWTGKPWDTTYLIDANPALVTDVKLSTHADELAEHYWTYNQVQGVIWPGMRSSEGLEFPDKYGTGGDGGIFTGFATAAFCFDYAEKGDELSKTRALASLRGLYWLTQAAGPGVICRCAFPAEDGAAWDYPGPRWKKYPQFMKAGPSIPAPWGPAFPESFYYTRGTKDQLTGILFGLTAAWVFLEDEQGVQETIIKIVKDIRDHLEAYNWKIRDKDGKNDTGADGVTDMIRLQLEALYRRTVAVAHPDQAAAAQQKYLDWFHTVSLADLFNIGNNYQEYFAHNLRSARALSIWLLEDDPTRQNDLASWVKRAVWRYTHEHQNGWVAAVMTIMNPDDIKPKIALKSSLQSLSLKPLRMWGSPFAGQKHEPEVGDILMGCEDKWVLPPHLRKPTNYWTWQKRPWDAGPGIDEKGINEETGIDFLAPYYMGKWVGALP